jgi:hypothetical protein
VQERAVTEADWAEVAARHPKVQRAVAVMRWTGSYTTVFVHVDRKGSVEVDAAFEEEMQRHLMPFRLAGYDIEISGPKYVPLDIALTICVEPGHFAEVVQRKLLRAFSAEQLPDGTLGFFHPDRLTFGQAVYLSQIVARATQIEGVRWVESSEMPGPRNRFKRRGEPARGELSQGFIPIGQLEIARCDNAASAPDHGQIQFYMEGGA